MAIELLTLKDLILTPIYIILLFFFTKYWADKYFSLSNLKRYIFPALAVRVLGCILMGLIYQFYYGTPDDGYDYYETSLTLNRIISTHPLKGLGILFTPIDSFTPEQWQLLNENAHIWVNNGKFPTYAPSFNPVHIGFRYESNAMICRLGGLLSFFTFKSYMCIGLLMTYFSFIGCWLLFLVFTDKYPKLTKEIAMATLFIPSVFFWSTGILKETLVMGALGLFIYTTYSIFLKKQSSILLWFFLSIAFLIIALIKTVFALVLIPCIFLWVFSSNQILFKTSYQKLGTFMLSVVAAVSLMYFIANKTDKFKMDKIVEQAFRYQNKQQSDSNSSYSLGYIESTLGGILKSIPIATFTGIFRPSVLDIKKVILAPAALENLGLTLLLLFSIYKTSRRRFSETLKIVTNPDFIFCLIFGLIIFFISGFTALNLGILVRHRLFALPFFTLALLFLSHNPKLEEDYVKK
jgi:hypothetical protein